MVYGVGALFNIEHDNMHSIGYFFINFVILGSVHMQVLQLVHRIQVLCSNISFLGGDKP